jgi:hypothetical protein
MNKKEKEMNSINKTARIAGLLYFIYVIASIIADLFGHFVFADASATINHIMVLAGTQNRTGMGRSKPAT